MNIRDKVWQRLVVQEMGFLPQPRFVAVDGNRIALPDGTADLADTLARTPGSYILKPRFGSNGYCVVRIVSHADGQLRVESDCPDTALYLEEFPADPELRGRDLVAAAALHRSRYVDRARVGLSDAWLPLSILEDEIPQHRAEGSLFEPRIVVQRVSDSPSRFAILGAICKRIDTAIGASVVRDFREEPLDESLRRFLGERVAPTDLIREVQRIREELLTISDQMQVLLAPLLEEAGARVHQYGIDCRLCWNATLRRVEFPFLEFQFGIGQPDPNVFGLTPFPGYQTQAELAARFGREVG